MGKTFKDFRDDWYDQEDEKTLSKRQRKIQQRDTLKKQKAIQKTITDGDDY